MSNPLNPSEESNALVRVVAPTGAELVRQVESGLGLVEDVLREGDAEYWFNLGMNAFKSKDHKGSITYLNQALLLRSNWAQAYLLRALAKFDQKDDSLLPSILFDLDNALKISPKYVAAYNNRGRTKQKLGDHIGAWEDYESALTLDPSNAIIINNRGNAKMAQSDASGALSDYDLAITMSPEYAFAYRNRGDAKRMLGDLDGAKSDYDKAIEINPKYIFAYQSRGHTKEALGDFAGAQADFVISTELERQANQKPFHSQTI